MNSAMTAVAGNATEIEVPDPLTEIDIPAAWRGPDMARDPVWLETFSQEEIAELETACARVRDQGIALIDVDERNFVLPRLGERLRALRDEVVEGRGFVLLRGLPVADWSLEQAATAYWGIGRHFGNPRSQNGKGHLLGHVRDLGLDLKDESVRVYQTRERQTFHTDSCDIVSLLCLKTARRGGLSALVSSVTVYNEMVRRRPDLARRLFQPFATDRRGEIPDGQMPWFDLPVFNWFAGRLSTIYARRYIDSAQRFEAARRLAPEDIEALDLFDSLAEDPALNFEMEFRPGDIQFVNNHVMLHDRTGYEDWPEPERKRHLLRLWLAPPNGRPLPEIYAQRYGSVEIGNRGGIICRDTALCAPLTAE